MTIPKYWGSRTKNPPAKRTFPGAETKVVLSLMSIVWWVVVRVVVVL